MLILLGVVIGLIVLVLVLAAAQPDTFVVQRKNLMEAPAKKIFAHLNDFKTWGKWSPWEKIDPAMKKAYSGKAKGVGSVYAWEGNKQNGTGRMEIIEATSPPTSRSSSTSSNLLRPTTSPSSRLRPRAN